MARVLKVLVLFLLVMGLIIPIVNATLDGSLIDDASNPTLGVSFGDNTEYSMIQDPADATIIHMWYRRLDGVYATIWYTNATNALGDNWGTPVQCTDIKSNATFSYGILPSVVYDTTTAKYYMFVDNGTGNVAIRLYNSTNRINWTVMNGGNPVLVKGQTTPTSTNVYNVGVAIVNSSYWPMLVEGKGADFTLSYTYSNLTELNWTKHLSTSAVIPAKSGNPALEYIPGRNALLAIAGNTTTATWKVGTYYASLSSDLSLAASWHFNGDLITQSGIHITDPAILFPTGKTYGTHIIYNYDQNLGYQKFVDLTRTQWYDYLQGVLTNETTWNYTTPGTYYWVAPSYVDRISLKLVGGGGSGGAGAEFNGATGGSAGDNQIVSSVTVTPGTNYTIYVGDGGANVTPGHSSNNGGVTSGFGYSVDGGTGGVAKGGYPGTNGSAGVWTTSKYSEDGGSNGAVAGGTGGVGHGGGGGGGADFGWSPGGTGLGGYGAPGYMQISMYGYSGENQPDFVADATTGSPGTLIHFTDLSTISNATGLTYEWNFGDGGTSNTTGDVNHVYSYTGIYTVSLTITSDDGTATETKTDYITITSVDYFDPNTPPKPVRFHIQTLWGKPLPGATVSALGITTSTGNWDWVVTLLGIPLDEVGINGTAMIDTTDSNGNIEFLMIPSAKYNITTTLSGYSFPVFYVTPHDSQYNIVAALNGTGWFETGNDTLSQVNISVTSNKISDTVGQINISYYDAGGTTVGGSVNITQDNATRGGADVLVVSIPITSNLFNESRNVTIPQEGIGYKVAVNPNPYGTAGPDIKAIRSFAVWFKGSPVLLAGFSPTILLWFSVFLLIFTAMFAGATHAPQMAIILCVEAWVLFSMGWLDPLETQYWVGQPVLIFTLGFATVMAIFWNFREGKRKEKGT